MKGWKGHIEIGCLDNEDKWKIKSELEPKF